MLQEHGERRLAALQAELGGRMTELQQSLIAGKTGELERFYETELLPLADQSVEAALLAWEHSLVRPDDLSRLGVAFFNVNGYVAVLALAAVLAGMRW